jgi:uncharacterized protein YqhQ
MKISKREYKITIHSIIRFLIGMIIILPTILITLSNFGYNPESGIITFLEVVIIFIISIYLSHLLSKAKVKIIMNEDGYYHMWEKRYLFSKAKSLKISWNIIDNFVMENERTFDNFIINLNNGRRYKISRLSIFPIEDDFKKLVNDFPIISNHFLLSNNNERQIVEGEPFYKSKGFKFVLFVMLGILIFLTISKINETNSITSCASLMVIASGLLFYLLKVYSKKEE